MEGLRVIWRRHLSPFRRELAILSVLGLFSAVANGVVPYVTGRFFDALVGVSVGKTTLASAGLPLWAFLLMAWAFVQLVANNIDWIIDRRRRILDTGLNMKIQVSGFEHFFRLPIAFHKNTHTNGAIQKMSQASWRIPGLIRTVILVAPEFLSIIIGIMLAASINLILAGVLFGGVVVYALLLLHILRPIAALDKEVHTKWNEYWDDAAQAVHQIESVKQATAEVHEIKRMDEHLTKETVGLWNSLERIWSNVSFFQRTIVFLTQLTVFILSANFVASGVITVGELIALNGYALMFFGPLVQLGYSWQLIQNGITTALQVEKIFLEPEEQYVPDGAPTLPSTLRTVAFNNVTFRYGTEEPTVLDGVNFSVAPGEVVAIVGESGVGKSTVAGLLSAYYFPTSGEVLVGGIDTRTLDLLSLRQKIAVVPQEIALFNESLRTNILYGSFTATDDAVRHAASEAHLAGFIATLPQGYETLVGERGIKLSVGQKQRVAIARAILRDPRILILDEPTSALDAKTEVIITTALERLMQGRTTFIIAHRLSTVRKADRILVFEKGKIVEDGTHDALLKKKNGVYRKLYEYQVGLY
ncbi:MAG: hypothetical protein A2942_00685 [Candidatus Lloydbacteria bacterium RIFCSPLOWO2_01_FULL_50_20]|uniref:ABC transporter ATP-binding protein n=1 Tax=Candidatus Lloydbacteria bacterium RIFCSPLOWO2_01_FULL_50_20 TaxID=1798665 RepID=A0A1G2DDF9_9BACT|nr:MAG: hypothetical protein A2942_00685 [Candidatus Lloydbacteria bacterium RIFCSPLOWO2_01_FULL_50_20]